MQQEHRVVDDPEPGGAAGERQHDRLAEAAGHVRGELEGAAALGVDGGLDEAGDNDGAVVKLGGLRFAGHLELHPLCGLLLRHHHRVHVDAVEPRPLPAWFVVRCGALLVRGDGVLRPPRRGRGGELPRDGRQPRIGRRHRG